MTDQKLTAEQQAALDAMGEEAAAAGWRRRADWLGKFLVLTITSPTGLQYSHAIEPEPHVELLRMKIRHAIERSEAKSS